MSNIFDQFDERQASPRKQTPPAAPKTSGNIFDQFDERRQNPFDQFDESATPEVVEAEPRNYALSEVPWAMATNFRGDVGEFGMDLGTAAMNLPQTAKGLGQVAAGVGDAIISAPARGARFLAGKALNAVGADEAAQKLQNLPTTGLLAKVPGAEDAAQAVWNDLVDKYGGYENLKRYVAEHPFDAFMDAATALYGGSLALKGLKAGGIAGKAGTIAGKVSRLSDPILGAKKAARVGGQLAGGIAKAGAAIATGKDYEWISNIVKAGAKGAGRPHSFTNLVKAYQVGGGADVIKKVAMDTLRVVQGGGTARTGSALALVYGAATGAIEIMSPQAWALIALHHPGVVSEIAYTAGQVKHLAKTVVSTERVLRKVGIAPRAAELAVVQGTEVATQVRHRDALKAQLKKTSDGLGYKMSNKVFDRVIDQLMTGDYEKGIKTIQNNKRLQEIITKAGEPDGAK